MATWEELGNAAKMLNLNRIEPRDYQINIAKSILTGHNSLVVLPTGLGKTLIAVIAIAETLSKGKKAILLAPTKPLSEQHYQSLSGLLNIEKDKILLLTGSLGVKMRSQMEADAKVIVATPQTLSNDLRMGRMKIEDFGIVIFDECHRAVGRYAYTYIADECNLHSVQLVGLTASPGSNKKRINALISALGIDNIEMRKSTDYDVAQYVMDKSTTAIYVQKDALMTEMLSSLKAIIDEHLSKLNKHGLSQFSSYDNVPKGRILQIGDNISKLQSSNYKYMAMFNYVYLLNLSHAYDLLSTEGFYSFYSYMDSLKQRDVKSRALLSILGNETVIKLMERAKEALDNGIEHPKIFKIIELIINELKGKTVIIFAQYRSTIKKIVELLNQYGISAKAFVGKKEGVTHEGQKAVIESFRRGEFSALVATSIGEEGLDIPSVDAVIFYEPIPNEIRNIQRRGRAGRIKYGEVYILITRGTKDEIYFMISRTREKRMYELLTEAVESARSRMNNRQSRLRP
jgi:Fanconi anemia group M protein